VKFCWEVVLEYCEGTYGKAVGLLLVFIAGSPVGHPQRLKGGIRIIILMFGCAASLFDIATTTRRGSTCNMRLMFVKNISSF